MTSFSAILEALCQIKIIYRQLTGNLRKVSVINKFRVHSYNSGILKINIRQYHSVLISIITNKLPTEIKLKISPTMTRVGRY